jgi:hypothetical protein
MADRSASCCCGGLPAEHPGNRKEEGNASVRQRRVAPVPTPGPYLDVPVTRTVDRLCLEEGKQIRVHLVFMSRAQAAMRRTRIDPQRGAFDDL